MERGTDPTPGRAILPQPCPEGSALQGIHMVRQNLGALWCRRLSTTSRGYLEDELSHTPSRHLTFPSAFQKEKNPKPHLSSSTPSLGGPRAQRCPRHPWLCPDG